MIEAIGTHGGIALTLRDPRSEQRRSRAAPRRRSERGDPAWVDVDDALAAVDRDARLPGETAPGDGATVTAITVALRLAAAGGQAVAIQARLGPAAVRRLAGADG